MRGVVFYGGSIDSAIQALKHEDLKQLAAPLATYLIDYLEDHPIPFDALVPVPLHPDRLTIRGYNQSDLLAECVGKARSIPVRTDLIIRTRDTKPQVHLKRSERLENVHEAFEPAQAATLDGETILRKLSVKPTAKVRGLYGLRPRQGQENLQKKNTCARIMIMMSSRHDG